MPDHLSPNLSLPYLASGQAQKHVTLNETIRHLDALVQARVVSEAHDAPASPLEGGAYLVGSPASGVFAGQEAALASFHDGAWSFHAPQSGWRVWNIARRSLFVFDGRAWRLAGRERLTSGRTYHVNAAGSDAADGLSPLTPFATLQRAIDAALDLDCGGQSVTIQLADGIHEGPMSLSQPLLGTTRLIISGNEVSPDSVTLRHTGNLISVTGGAKLMLSGVRLTTHSVWGSCLYVSEGGVVDIGRVIFGDAVRMHIELAGSAKVNLVDNYAIDGGAIRHFSATGAGAFIEGANRTLTLTGTPAFSEAFAGAFSAGSVLLFNVTYDGGGEGRRYLATYNGTIQIFAGQMLPGDEAGVLMTGGQFG